MCGCGGQNVSCHMQFGEGLDGLVNHWLAEGGSVDNALEIDAAVMS